MHTTRGRRLLCWYWRILLILSINLTTRYYILYQVHSSNQDLIMRQGRGSEATETVFCLQAKKPLHSGSYEHRVPRIKDKTFFCTRDVCVIQHRNWPLRSTILNAHGTNASPNGLCTRTHTNEAFSCRFCCNSFRVDRARRGNVFIKPRRALLPISLLSVNLKMVWVLI